MPNDALTLELTGHGHLCARQNAGQTGRFNESGKVHDEGTRTDWSEGELDALEHVGIEQFLAPQIDESRPG